MKKSTRIGLILAIILVAALAALAECLVIRDDDITKNPNGLITSVKMGGAFNLIDHKGNTVTEKNFLGNYVLVFFGYTFCPDACPTALADVALVLDELGRDSMAATSIMITIDPKRDKPDVLSEYITLFHDRIIGLTGTEKQIKEVAEKYRVFYRRVDDQEYSFYLMDHTSFIYLVDPKGTVISLFRYGTPPSEIADTIRKHMKG